MKYVVGIGGRDIEVEVDGDQVTCGGKRFSASLGGIPGTPLRHLTIDDRPTELSVAAAGEGRWTLTVRGEGWESEVLDERSRHIRSLGGAIGRQRGTPPLKAPMPGLVLRVLAEPGQLVPAGGGVVVLEAMKMENELRSAVGAVVRAVRVKAGEPVEKGQVLVEFDAT